MNIAFYVSGKAGRLQNALRGGNEALLNCVKLVFSDDSQNLSLEQEMSRLGILYRCMDYKSIPKNTRQSKNLQMSNELLRFLKKHEIDYCFSFGSHLLTGQLLKEYENRIINFHPSILPLFPGLLAIDQAINSGSNLMGNTAHFIDAGVDTGAIIMQNIISSRDFHEGGYEAVLNQQIPMLYQIIEWLEQGRLKVESGKVYVEGADYRAAAFFPALENGRM